MSIGKKVALSEEVSARFLNRSNSSCRFNQVIGKTRVDGVFASRRQNI